MQLIRPGSSVCTWRLRLRPSTTSCSGALSALVRAQIADVAQGKPLTHDGGSDNSDFFHGLTPSTPASHTLLHGAVTVTDPALFVDASSKINNIISGATLSATFLSYAPCLILNQPYGFGVFPFGLNVQPTAVYIVPAGFNVQPQGFNVAPTLIYVGPVGRNIAPQGFNVAPALISVAPVRHGLLASHTPSCMLDGSCAGMCACASSQAEVNLPLHTISHVIFALAMSFFPCQCCWESAALLATAARFDWLPSPRPSHTHSASER